MPKPITVRQAARKVKLCKDRTPPYKAARSGGKKMGRNQKQFQRQFNKTGSEK
jgi:hypothetical protein